MIRSIPFPGAWYAYALPDGRYVVLNHDGTMHSPDGLIPAPFVAAGCLYPVLNPAASGIMVAGQAWQPGTNKLLTWDGAWFIDESVVACGVYPCIYGPGGSLAVNVGCEAGTQGFRYVAPDGEIITGDETYGPTGRWRLWEWTILAGADIASATLVVGQGENGGCIIWDNGVYRELVPESAGVARFIHAVTTGQTDADTFGLAFWGETGIPTSVYFGALGDLRVLPMVSTFPPELPPELPPSPPIRPLPPQVPMTTMPAAAWALIQECHRRFASALPVTEDGARMFTKMCIEQLAYNFPSEGWCWKAADPGRPVSKDIVARQAGGRFDGWDILHAASLNGPRVLVESPGWHDLAGQFPILAEQDHQGWVWMPTNHLDLLVPPTPVPPTPQPPVPPVPGNPTNAEILAAVNRLQADFDRVFRG